jgi:hypothetical protein
MITLAGGIEVTTAGGTGVECLTEIAGARTTVTISFTGVGATNGRPYMQRFLRWFVPPSCFPMLIAL